ncbi:hypothetical protein [Alistipes sp.]|uniref:hypothetical protein n=1 Tax=Alistipes sp. TaxID=1872444 RepID=UPI003526FFC1
MKKKKILCAIVESVPILLVIAMALLFAYGLTGCGTTRKLAQTETIDSMRVERVEVIRLDTVRVPIPVERVETVVPADTTSTLHTSLARSTAGLHGGLLYHTLENRTDVPITAVVPVKDTETTTEQVRREVIQEPYPVETPLTWWQRFRMSVGGWAMAALTGIVGWWALKMFVLKR